MELRMQYKIVDASSGKVLGTGQSREAAIAAAAAAMHPGTKQHLADMQLTPSSVVENMLENGDYNLVMDLGGSA
jgi:hypothetical protein